MLEGSERRFLHPQEAVAAGIACIFQELSLMPDLSVADNICITNPPRRRGLIVVISDFIGDGDWGQSLLRLVLRHEVVALRVVDAADDELPDVGLVVVEDAETGEQLIIDSSDPMLRTRLRARVEERDTGLAAGMRRAGVPIHRIGTDADLATALIEVVASTQRRRA